METVKYEQIQCLLSISLKFVQILHWTTCRSKLNYMHSTKVKFVSQGSYMPKMNVYHKKGSERSSDVQ